MEVFQKFNILVTGVIILSSLTNQWGILRATVVSGDVTVKFQSISAPITWGSSFTNLQYIGSGTASLPFYCAFFMLNLFTQVNDNFFENLLASITNNSTLATYGSIESASVSASIVISGYHSGSDIVIIQSGTTNVLASVDASTDSSWTYNYSTTQNVDIAIYKSGYVPYIIRNYTLSGGLNVPIVVSQLVDRNYV